MKSFREYVNENTVNEARKGFMTDPDEIKEWLDEMGVKKYKINRDGTVDVNGDVDIYDLGLKEISVQFGEVEGDFRCDKNKLTSLEGAPKKVGGDFWVFNNRLTSLEGVPKEVKGEFDCSENKLTTLEGAPEHVKGDFNCNYSQLTSLEGAPQYVGGSFYCEHNKLKSLEGAPKEVGGTFYCHHNPGDFTKKDVKSVSDVGGKIYT